MSIQTGPSLQPCLVCSILVRISVISSKCCERGKMLETLRHESYKVTMYLHCHTTIGLFCRFISQNILIKWYISFIFFSAQQNWQEALWRKVSALLDQFIQVSLFTFYIGLLLFLLFPTKHFFLPHIYYRSGSVVVNSTLVFQNKSSAPDTVTAVTQLNTELVNSALNVIPGSVSARKYKI